MGFINRFVCVCLLVVISTGCGSKKDKDPNRCQYVDVGEASDLVYKKDLMTDRLVIASGLTDPTSFMVWRDDKSSQVFAMAKIMGTERKLYYLRTVAQNEKPSATSTLKGHLVKWESLSDQRSIPMMKALKAKFNIDVNPAETYLILAGEKPRDCP